MRRGIAYHVRQHTRSPHSIDLERAGNIPARTTAPEPWQPTSSTPLGYQRQRSIRVSAGYVSLDKVQRLGPASMADCGNRRLRPQRSFGRTQVSPIMTASRAAKGSDFVLADGTGVT